MSTPTGAFWSGKDQLRILAMAESRGRELVHDKAMVRSDREHFGARWLSETGEPSRPAYNLELTTKELMKHAIDPAADIVWAASGYVVDEKGTTDLSPKTREGWAIVENNATIVAELSNALMLPGRSPGEPQWNDYSRRLHDAAMATKKAAHDQDRAGLL